MIKKIITWILLLVFSYGIFAINSDLNVFAVIGVMITLTLLMHLYLKNQKLVKFFRFTWKYSLLIAVISIILVIFTNLTRFPIFNAVTIVLIILFFTISFFLIVAYKKVDLVIIIMLGISILGMVFKHYHLPGAGLFFILGWTFPAVLFMFILYQKITEYDSRTNTFLNIFKNFICITLTISFLGINFKMMHWPGGELFNLIALPTSILAILLVVFLLPVSNFIEWTREHKRNFYLALLIPLIYLSTITALANVFPVTFREILFSESSNLKKTFFMVRYTITPAEGMEQSK